MRIVQIKEIEDCFDEDIMKEVVFDQPVEEAFIGQLGSLGRLQYFPHFARPFYRLDADLGFVLKGIQGNRTARLILGREKQREAFDLLERFVAVFGRSAPIST